MNKVDWQPTSTKIELDWSSIRHPPVIRVHGLEQYQEPAYYTLSENQWLEEDPFLFGFTLSFREFAASFRE